MALAFVPPTPLAPTPDRAFARWMTVVLAAVDVAVVMLAAVLALVGRGILPVFDDTGDDFLELVGPYTYLFAITWLLTMAAFGAYRSRVRVSGTTEYRAVAHASVVVAAVLGVGAYLLNYPLSRGFYVIFFTVGTGLLILGRYVVRRLIHRLHERGVGLARVVLAGDEVHVRELLEVLDRERWLGYLVVGALLNDSPRADLPVGMLHVGRPEDALRAVALVNAQVIIFADGAFARSADFSRLARQFDALKTQLVMAPGVSQVSSERITVRPMAGLPLVYVDRPQAQAATQWAKRTFDVVGALALVVLTSPVLAVCALLVKAHDGGPVLFQQPRIGRDSRPFTMLKFRSMVVDAEALLPQVSLSQVGEGNAVMFKLARDPRITTVGAVLRRWSMDELPQLFNVLRGEMSLVGPRPALEREVNLYDEDARRRLDVRPGMTGLWQVSGRSDLSWEDTVRLDVYYVDNWSMLQDLAILGRTVRAVLGSSGAY